jgi:hypothetical protein
VPQRSLATGKRTGRKQDKQRITVLLCCNATGTDKRKLLVIGKSKRPLSFLRDLQPERDWGIRYRHNNKATGSKTGIRGCRQHPRLVVVPISDTPVAFWLEVSEKREWAF